MIGASVGNTPLQAADDDRPNVQALIERIESEESRYQNFEVTRRTTYETALPEKPLTRVEWMRQVRHVRQGDRFLLESVYSRFRDADHVEFEHKLLAFDGDSFRFLSTADDRAEGHQLGPADVQSHSILSHTYIQPGTNHAVPLSAWLQGHDAVAEYPQGYSNGSDYHVSSLRTDGFDGLACDVVTVTATRKDSPDVSWKREYWLAVERNYIPIRILTVEPRRSSVTPIADGVVEELRELEPGVWFPWRASYTLYNRSQLERTGEQQLRWRELHVTESAVLNPRHGEDVFRDIGFGDLVLKPGTP